MVALLAPHEETAVVRRPPPTPVRLAPNRLVTGTRYRITSWLGAGGMGNVFEAIDEELDRRVALKVLNAREGEDPRGAGALRREARVTSGLGSEHIVQVYDLVTLEDGRVAYAMERLHGCRLTDILGSPVEPARVVAILRQIAQALRAAHRAGVVHRDIKPSNIFLVEGERRPDFVKVLDFGVAQVEGIDDGTTAGTPAYMSPEQIRGGRCDGQADLYSLGIIAYELLTGTRPFKGTSEQMLEQHLAATPNLEPVPAPFRTVVGQCLEKDPAHRPADIDEFEAALCEAQIELGIATAWDDLPLPDVEPERRARIAGAMPNPDYDFLDSRAASRFRIVLACVGLVTLVVTWLVWPGPRDDEVIRLVQQAQSAAAVATYVYPPVQEPEAVTAYRSVLALEDLGSSQAEASAEDLRDQYAAALSRLGERFRSREGGEPFAVDFYVQARFFRPEDPKIQARSMMSPGSWEYFRRTVEARSLTSRHLEALEPLRVLARYDDDQKQIATLLKDETIHLPTHARAALRQLAELPPDSDLVETPGSTTVSPSPNPPKAASVNEPATTSAGTKRPAVAITPEVAGAKTPAVPVTVERRPPSKAERKEAARLAKQAHQASSQLDFKNAESLYHRALSIDPRSTSALIGLSDLYFERDELSPAVRFAQRAVAVAPKNGGYRLRLGDAYFRMLRYEDARSEYEVARDLGVGQAESRLLKLRERLGE